MSLNRIAPPTSHAVTVPTEFIKRDSCLRLDTPTPDKHKDALPGSVL